MPGDGLSCLRIDPAREVWQAFLASQPEASIYHSPEFCDCLRLAGIRVRVLQCVDAAGRLQGLAVVILDRLFPLPLIGSKAFAPSGLLACSAQAADRLLHELHRDLGMKALYIEQFVEAREKVEQLLRHGYREDPHRNFQISLKGEAGGFRHAYSRAIVRNIRHAGRLGLRLAPCHGVEDLRQAQKLLEETCSRVSAPCLPWPLLKAVYRLLVPRGMARFYFALLQTDGGELPVNVRIELIYRGKAIDWYTGAAEEYIGTQAGTWLVDQVLGDLQQQGVELFDFGGGGRVGEEYGPAEFKRRFGGRQVDVTRCQKVFHPRLLGLARAAWRMLHRDQRGPST